MNTNDKISKLIGLPAVYRGWKIELNEWGVFVADYSDIDCDEPEMHDKTLMQLIGSIDDFFTEQQDDLEAENERLKNRGSGIRDKNGQIATYRRRLQIKADKARGTDRLFWLEELNEFNKIFTN